MRRTLVRIQSVFSAVETQKSKSSMVAMKVARFPSAFTSVNTQLPFLAVLMVKPTGVLKLSGETALAMAVAVWVSQYSSFIVASNIFALQLFSDQLVNSVYEVFNLVDGHLGTCSYVVSSPLSAVLF